MFFKHRRNLCHLTWLPKTRLKEMLSHGYFLLAPTMLEGEYFSQQLIEPSNIEVPKKYPTSVVH